jgi:hypothetical protein
MYNLMNYNLGKILGLNKVHKGDCFELKWFELIWKLNEIEYFEVTII